MKKQISYTSTEISYTSTGVVLGNFWGGGKGYYPARKLKGNTREEIIEQAEKGLDGSLDSGMGYESLIGAAIIIEKKTTVYIKGEPYTNTDDEIVFVGKLTDDQQEDLEQALYSFKL